LQIVHAKNKVSLTHNRPFKTSLSSKGDPFYVSDLTNPPIGCIPFVPFFFFTTTLLTTCERRILIAMHRLRHSDRNDPFKSGPFPFTFIFFYITLFMNARPPPELGLTSPRSLQFLGGTTQMKELSIIFACKTMIEAKRLLSILYPPSLFNFFLELIVDVNSPNQLPGKEPHPHSISVNSAPKDILFWIKPLD